MPDIGAPGWPGIPPRWTSSSKSGVGTALGSDSRLWFTLSHGIVNEIYYPRLDQACTRDMGLIVTADAGFFSEEKRHAESRVTTPHHGVPAYSVVNTCRHGRYRIEKQFVTDPRRDVLLQRTRFVALGGMEADYRLYVLLAPHLGNGGSGNVAWTGDYKGVPMLFAERGGRALALACSVPWGIRSAGFVGVSDGWQDLRRHGRLTSSYTRADNGNVALTGEIDRAADETFVLALGFGGNASEAAQFALGSLADGFDKAQDEYVRQWRTWHESLLPLEYHGISADLLPTSAAVLRTHESKRFRGALIASLSIPWGFAKGDDDLGGYHLVWPRDLVQTAGALVAIGACEEVRRVLNYLRVTQEADGHWPQNMWLDGTPYWDGVQMDEVALPILLVDLARRENAIGPEDEAGLWPMVRRAAGFIARNGPVTQQDRWEEDAGYAPFTLGAEIAALLVAADLADIAGEEAVGRYLRETADAWNASIEAWTYATDTGLARQAGVEGYYVRVAPPEVGDGAALLNSSAPIKNRPPGESTVRATDMVSVDALALVRFGLRAADDPRIVNTVRVIDTLLRADLPGGPSWRRYNLDGYGERADGAPFDGEGVGRPWPLLTGERAHYELAAGRPAQATALCHTLESFANASGFLPEQVWDAPDIPSRGLYFGKPTGSAMPLVWAHAEYVKLRRSLHDKHVFDIPPQTSRRYISEGVGSSLVIWRFNQKRRAVPAGNVLRIEVLAAGVVHWTSDRWHTVHDTATRDTGLGVHVADVPTAGLAVNGDIAFTFYWSEAHRWEGTDFVVTVEPA
jgi:glucoamylase